MYLAEYGGDGYDQRTFLDFVIAQLDLTRAGSGVPGLIDFYQHRAAELGAELVEPGSCCMVCNEGAGLRRYTVTVDGAPLRLAPLLCAEHGSRFLLRAGSLLATLEKPIEDVLHGWAVGGKAS